MIPAGEQFQAPELVIMLVLLVGLVPMTVQYLRHRNRLFYSAYVLFAAASIATNLESFSFWRVLNLVEHALVFVASILFWRSAYRSTADRIDMEARDVVGGVEEVIDEYI